MGSEYLQVILSLLGVLSLIFGSMFFLRKFKLARFATNKYIKILNMVSVGPKEKIILMEVNNTFILVGATPNHIDTLHTFKEMEPAKATLEDQAIRSTSFTEHMKKVVNIVVPDKSEGVSR